MHELAKVYGMSSQEVLDKLRTAGMSVKAPASAVDADVAFAALEDRTLPIAPDGLAQKTTPEGLLAKRVREAGADRGTNRTQTALKARDATSTERPRGEEASLLELINSRAWLLTAASKEPHRWRAMRNAAVHEGKGVSLESARQALADVATALALLGSC